MKTNITRLRISFKDTKEILDKIRSISVLKALTYLNYVTTLRLKPNNTEYCKSVEKLNKILYTLARKLKKENEKIDLDQVYFKKLYITKGPLLTISRFKRARGSTSPKYKNSCNLYIE